MMVKIFILKRLPMQLLIAVYRNLQSEILLNFRFKDIWLESNISLKSKMSTSFFTVLRPKPELFLSDFFTSFVKGPWSMRRWYRNLNVDSVLCTCIKRKLSSVPHSLESTKWRCKDITVIFKYFLNEKIYFRIPTRAFLKYESDWHSPKALQVEASSNK